MNDETNPITFAEFFAGIGLVRDAIAPLGWRCTFANDISEQKAEMYRARFGDTDLVVGDVADIKAADLPPGLNLVTASFPCIDVSLAGNRAGLAGKHTGAYWPFFFLLKRYCEESTPPNAILLENVTGLVSSHGGADLEKIILSLNELGYLCDLLRIDAKWFVPQSRPRLFVVALRRDDPKMTRGWERKATKLRPAPIQRFVLAHPDLELAQVILPDPPERSEYQVWDVLEEISGDSDLWWPDGKSSQLVNRMEPRHRARVEQLCSVPGLSAGTIYRRVRHGRTVGEIRIDGIAGCLRTPIGGSSIQFLAQADGDHVRIRRLTGREYARLQGVSDDYPILVSDRQAMLGFGDAVCVPAVNWLVNHAFGHIVNSVPHRTPGTHKLRLFERPERYGGKNPSNLANNGTDPFTTAERSAIMRKIHGKDTSPELLLRRALWKTGLRYRTNVKDLPGKPDIVFRRQKVAVFVDGEFWHGKKLSADRLSRMSEYWQRKISRNVERDKRVNAELSETGWRVLRIGERAILNRLNQSIHAVASLVGGEAIDEMPAGVELHQLSEGSKGG